MAFWSCLFRWQPGVDHGPIWAIQHPIDTRQHDHRLLEADAGRAVRATLPGFRCWRTAFYVLTLNPETKTLKSAHIAVEAARLFTLSQTSFS